jgi:hypothetical protein
MLFSAIGDVPNPIQCDGRPGGKIVNTENDGSTEGGIRRIGVEN